jgi:nitroreductase
MNTSVIEAIERQKTTNLYDASKSIPDDEIRELVRLATFSPTAFHLQNWRFIAVRSPEAKARLRAVAADQPKVTEAAVTFIMVGELAVADVMADRLAGSVAYTSTGIRIHEGRSLVGHHPVAEAASQPRRPRAGSRIAPR